MILNSPSENRLHFREAVRAKPHPIIMELPTPKGVDCDKMLSFVKETKEYVDAFLAPDVPTGRIRVDPTAVSRIVLDHAIADAISSISVRHRSYEANVAKMLGAWLMGVHNLYIVMGDPCQNDEQERTYGITSAVNIIRIAKDIKGGTVKSSFGSVQISGHPDFFVGSALLPSRKGEEKLVTDKLGAGVDFFITQISFESEALCSFLDTLKQDGININKPIFIALPLIKHERTLDVLRNLEGVNIPDRVKAKLRSSTDLEKTTASLSLEVFESARSTIGRKLKLGAYVLPLAGSLRSVELLKSII